MSTPAKHNAGIFDIRMIIGLLLLVYGVILTAMGLFADPELGKTGGINANLIAGLALLAVGCFFAAWARLRPIIVDETQLTSPESPGGTGH